jgi:leader peptidase (prepilin peptidase)/N-methyltransferase
MSLFIQELAEILSFSFIFTALASRILAVFFIALFFSSIGSFLNVCIYRVPLKLSIIKPDSYCPKCKTPIKPWHNIPVISYFLLRGRCYYCHERFSFRYCLVEIITAMLAIVFFIKNGWVLDLVFLKFVIFMCFSIMIIFIDLDHHLILDKHNYTLLILGFLFSLAGTIPLWNAISGALTGFIIFYLIALLYWISRKVHGLGGGDIKFISAIGMFTGISGVLFTIFFSSIFALILNFNNFKKPKELAFGPYLAFASLLYFFFGDTLIRWYLDFFIT